MSREPLNGFAPNSHGTRVWSLARTSLNLKVKVKGQRLKVMVTRDKKRHFPVIFRRPACGLFGKTSLAS